MNFKCFSVIVTVILLSACASISMSLPGYQGSYIKSVTVVSNGNLPDNIPLAVDIIFISSAKAQQSLKGMTNEQWFARKPQLLAMLNEQLDVMNVELVPSYSKITLDVKDDYRRATKVIVIPRRGNKMTIPQSFKHPVLSFNDQGLVSIDEYDSVPFNNKTQKR